jgi:DegV family protein with EDD domain
METKIIMDSCVDFNDTAFDPAQEYARIPFKINIDGEEIVDRDLNTFLLVDKMKLSKHKMTTSCPSPKEYLDAINPDKINYIVTISGKLSGSYNSAVMAQKMAAEEGITENVHVFDSQSAVTGEDLIVMKINELVARGLPPIDIVPIVRDYITNMTTFFILQSLDNLAKNGRLRPAVALIGKMLKIVPIMNGNQGEIELKDKVRGRKKAFQRLVEIITTEAEDAGERILAITHVHAPAQAESLKKSLLETKMFKDIVVFEAGGLSTFYADNGGIVVSY